MDGSSIHCSQEVVRGDNADELSSFINNHQFFLPSLNFFLTLLEADPCRIYTSAKTRAIRQSFEFGEYQKIRASFKVVNFHFEMYTNLILSLTHFVTFFWMAALSLVKVKVEFPLEFLL